MNEKKINKILDVVKQLVDNLDAYKKVNATKFIVKFYKFSCIKATKEHIIILRKGKEKNKI